MKVQRATGDAKTFAEHMVADHKKTSSELKALVQSGKVQVQIPSELDNAHKSKLDKLRGMSGKDFTEAYVDMQVDAHKDAVSLFERYSKGGDNAELKSWAGKTLPNLQAHLKLAQDLDKK